jgi:hypothetical protein
MAGKWISIKRVLNSGRQIRIPVVFRVLRVFRGSVLSQFKSKVGTTTEHTEHTEQEKAARANFSPGKCPFDRSDLPKHQQLDLLEPGNQAD